MEALYSLPELKDLKPKNDHFSRVSYQIDKTLGIHASRKPKKNRETDRIELKNPMFKRSSPKDTEEKPKWHVDYYNRLKTEREEDKRERCKKIIALNLQRPAVGRYNPNYESITAKSPAVNFNHMSGHSFLGKKENDNRPLETGASEYSHSSRRKGWNFDKYSPRKALYKDVGNTDVLCYDNKNMNKPVGFCSFAKMSKRGDLIQTESYTPSVAYYSPGYSLVEKNRNKYVPYSVKKIKSPKSRVRKLWSKYQVGSNYELVNI